MDINQIKNRLNSLQNKKGGSQNKEETSQVIRKGKLAIS